MTISEYVWRVPSFDIGDRLAKARESADISQERMGQLLGCSRRTIVRYESSSGVPRSVVLAYHVATETDLRWLETGYTPRDLNPEPTGSRKVRALPTTLRVEADSRQEAA